MAQDHWDLGIWNRIPVTMHWTVLVSFAWLYFLFWDLLATAIGSVALFALFVAHEAGHVFLLRRKKIRVSGIMFGGIHGETSYDFASPKDAALIAWGGVFAQMLILLAAFAIPLVFDLSALPSAAMLIVGPIYFVFTKVNIFLMVVALLPIGPFDGREAWSAFGFIRTSLRRRFRRTSAPTLTAREQRELEAKSRAEAADLLDRLTRKNDKEDAS